jgi:hypothetical protein
MLQVLLVILIGIQLALLYRSARESSVRSIEMRYKLRRREKLEAGLSKDTDAAAAAIERLTEQLAESQVRAEEATAEIDQLELKKQRIRSRPPIRLYIFDRTTLTSDNLWEVTIINPEFMELASSKRAPPELAQEWSTGRIFLVASSTAEDAAIRCGARFPGSLGYRVASVAPYRGLNRNR